MRKLNIQSFIGMMQNLETSGLDITLLVLCHMFHISIVVLFERKLWKSHDYDLNDFHVYLVMFKGGRFISATPRTGYHMSIPLPDETKALLKHQMQASIV